MDASRSGDDGRERMGRAAARWVVSAARGGGEKLRAMTPNTLLALLAAAAFTDILTPGGALLPAVAGLLSGMGGNYLSGLLERTAERLRVRPAESPDAVTAELAAELLAALQGQDSVAREVRAELAEIIGRVDMVAAAVDEALRTHSKDVVGAVVGAFAGLEREFQEFAFLLGSIHQESRRIAADMAAIRTEQHQSAIMLRHEQDQRRHHYALLSGLYELAADLEQRTRQGGRLALPAPETSPYRGLYPFDETHAAYFHGREALTGDLCAAVADRLAIPSPLIVSGASGAGKSSLLRAGLLPALSRGTLPVPGAVHWPTMVLTPTAEPLRELALRLAMLHSPGTAPAAHRALIADPAQAPLLVRQAVAGHAERLGMEGNKHRLVLVVDQFEEVFTLAPADQRAAYVTALDALANSGEAIVVIGVRGDMWARCAEHPELAAALQDGQFVVTPMTEADLAAAITGPAAVAGLGVTDGLVEAVLRDLGAGRVTIGTPEEGVLPLLSQAMLRTWQAREGSVLTVRAYESAGGVRDAVRRSAEEAYDTLNGQQAQMVRPLMRALTLVTIDGELVRRPTDLLTIRNALGPDADAIVSPFVAGRLIVLERDSVTIAHDTLLRAWPRLRTWSQEDQADRVARLRLTEHARDWAAAGRDAALLYRSGRLQAAKEMAVSDPLEQEFLQAAYRQERRGVRVRRTVTAALAILLTLTTGAAVALVQANQRAVRQRDLAVARQLIADSQVMGERDPVLARLLALAATEISPGLPEARVNLRQAQARPAVRAAPTAAGSTVALGFDGGAPIVAESAGPGVVGVRELLTGRAVRTLRTPHGSALDAMAFSTDGRYLATGAEGQVLVWDLGTGRQVSELEALHYVIKALAFSPDGTKVAINDGSVGIWNRTGGRRLMQFSDFDEKSPQFVHRDPDLATLDLLAYHPSGRILATTARNASFIQVWNVGEDTPSARKLPVAGAGALAFSPDGDLLAIGLSDGAVQLRRVATGKAEGTPPAGTHRSGHGAGLQLRRPYVGQHLTGRHRTPVGDEHGHPADQPAR
ncbi:NACHT and WD repeat domain-containing protein [Nonomuraea sp. NPDC004186]